MFLIFLIPVFWFVSLPLILKFIVGIAFFVIGIIRTYQYVEKKKREKQEEDEKYERFFKKTTNI